MKLSVINVYEMFGVSTKHEGKPREYNMKRLSAFQPYQNVQSDNMTRKGIGLAVLEVTVSDAFYPVLLSRFLSEFKGLPLTYDLENGLISRGRNTETIITGFSNEASNFQSTSEAQSISSDSISYDSIGLGVGVSNPLSGSAKKS